MRALVCHRWDPATSEGQGPSQEEEGRSRREEDYSVGLWVNLWT